MRVWTRQHKSVLDELTAHGRYAAGRGGVYLDLGEHAPLVLEAYDWLSAHHPLRAQRPKDAEGLVWLSYEKSAAMLANRETALLELEIPDERIAPPQGDERTGPERRAGLHVPLLPRMQARDHGELGTAL